MPYYDPNSLAQGKSDLSLLSADCDQATTYGDSHLASVGSRDGGIIYNHWLSAHDDSVAKFEALVTATKTLLGNASTNLDQTMTEYAKGEQANLDEVARLWADLQMSEGIQPVGPTPDGGPTAGPLPSTVLVPPETNVGHWIFDVLSWPDYLSIGSWARKILGWIWEGVTGTDPWSWLWEWLGGDYEKIGLTGDAWSNLGEYYRALPEELLARMQIMFQGWYDSDAATAAGEYFAEAIRAIGTVSDPLSSLGKQYDNIAWSSYGFCQAIYSLIDAAIDAIVAFLMGGATILEAIAAFFSGGATAIPAAVTAVIAAVQAVSSAWGWMMTAVYGVVGLGALLGAATTEINWVTLPEG